MFKRIRNAFKKKKEEKVICGITIYNQEDGETYIDVRMSDHSDKSLHSSANIISMFNPSSVIQILSIIKMQLDKTDDKETYYKIVEHLSEFIVESDTEIEEDPCINPSDVL
jgi:Pyruvate/2-oxoacid:ferredoxin oxidoreductase gamma subunit